MSYKLEKMKIKPEKGSEFKVLFNPESYSMTYENTFSPLQGVGASGKEQTYSRSAPATLDMTLIFDTTGASGVAKSLKDKKVQDQVDKFLKATTQLNGSLHRPPKVTVNWGSKIFEGFIESVTVNYTLFDREGKPIRAELETSFTAHIDDGDRESADDLKSADLTHGRVVAAGDNLTLLAKEIYDDPACYIHVAKANKLVHFRKLEPGSELCFPPMED
ncbi:conserved hypothetical protein [Candidatus Desulfarcum epimagneticum]|uniref:Contractile injection system tube protein N-terminal domain-containing protein n=1 Tax=uncultured Desulfobacteraceae bacterium TaxID=218296 RepID=A0A484HEA6_9BACT|nr:conserved hypothetical protein [uncultured Desulfobacteraceae bacterium]